MSTERLVKWSKEAKEFFEKAKDNSLVLDLVISYGCLSQTLDGFEDLVNSINSINIKRKVKKVNILDTSYLYRHTIPSFSKYKDSAIPTLWFLNNKRSIEKLTINYELKSWANELIINNDKFKTCYERIFSDCSAIAKFKNLLDADCSAAVESKKGTFEESKNFLLEEMAYTCSILKDSILVYPVPFTPSFVYAIKKYTRIRQLRYKISRESQHTVKCFNPYDIDRLNISKVDKEVASFIKNDVSNVSFYVIDKFGNYITKNDKFCKISKELSNAMELDTDSWKNCLDVMKQNKQVIIEEQFQNNYFLSIKKPLVIDGKIEGIIGLSIDITEKKKIEELESKLKMREELYKIAKEVSHDIASPVMSLKIIEEMYKGKLKEQDERMLKTAIRSIEDMAGKMLSKYRINKNVEMGMIEEVKEKEEKVNIHVYESMNDIVENMRYRSKGDGVVIKIEREKGKVYIKGDKTDFRRMMINVIKNGIEAIDGKEGKEGEIEVRYEEVEIKVKDNGKGMSKDMAEKIERGEEVGTTKKEGHGIGMGQVMGVVREMKGKIKVESREGEGTEFILTFPKAESPSMIKN
jgi:signal transduction histidine kinase